ncbi:MAG: PLP-dependent transferase [Candidatus Eisenbacteria bacterium]|nr:PLP-dependent transferase [Candidatus Eisenbacteria bacterium]
MRFETKTVRAGIVPDPTTGAIVPPIYQTATYVLEEVGRNRGFDYTRASNPTRQMLEENLAAIEGGRRAVAYASGLSAVDAILRLFEPGDHIVSTDDVYGGVYRLFERILSRYGLRFTYVDSTDPRKVERAITRKTRMVWIETPTNPLLKVTDLEAVGAICRKKRVLYGVDSTFATPALLRPFEFGADLVMHSTTKYLSGHNQIIGGAVVMNDDGLFERLKFVQKAVGAVPSPFDCWLVLMGVKTLAIRMARHSENGMTVARFLEAHPKVKRISYPGLESHPEHQVARRQMRAFGGMISFELKGGIPAGRKLMNSVRLCSLAESLGAVETMVTHPATMTHAEVPKKDRLARGLTDGLVRISVGIEHPDDIIDDLKQALR